MTQLSLYLKLLEDETTATANDMQVLFKEQILPSLNNNIVCGNSLIETDYSEASFFELHNDFKLKPMNFGEIFPAIIKEGGFDAIIGNPPYVNLVAIEDTQRKYFQNKYKTCRNKSDLYSFFTERAIGLLNKKSSRLGYIIPHTWLATDSFKPLRELLLDKNIIEQIVELGFGVFKKVVVSTIILIGCKGAKTIQIKNNDFSERFEVASKTFIENDYHIDLNWNPKIGRLYKKLADKSVPLGQILQFSRGIKTSNDSKFIVDKNINSEYKKIYRGRNIKSYQLNWNGEYIWYRPDLMKKKVGCLPHSKEFFEVPEKLVTQRVNSSMQLLVAYDTDMNYFLDTTNVSRYESWDKKYPMKYLCALLNSKLINYWYCNKYKMPTIGLYELHSIPIHVVDFNSQKGKKYISDLCEIVDQIIALRKHHSDLKTESDIRYSENKYLGLITKIDHIVYDIYDLTEEEIETVESSLK